MHLKVVACEVLAREVYHCAARARNTIEIELFTQGLHDNSDVMRDRLQEKIDSIEAERYDALLLGYGLCNNGIVGLRAANLEIVIPRGHDCITFLLGSRERYAEQFEKNPGTYYYSSGWIEYPERGGEKPELMEKSGLGQNYRKFQEYEKLVEQYGEDNARYLAEFMGQWQQHYTHGALIDFDFAAHLKIDSRVMEICDSRGWEFMRLQGRLDLVQDWLNGEWDEQRYLCLKPGQTVVADYHGGIIKAVESPADTKPAESEPEAAKPAAKSVDTGKST